MTTNLTVNFTMNANGLINLFCNKKPEKIQVLSKDNKWDEEVYNEEDLVAFLREESDNMIICFECDTNGFTANSSERKTS